MIDDQGCINRKAWEADMAVGGQVHADREDMEDYMNQTTSLAGCPALGALEVRSDVRVQAL